MQFFKCMFALALLAATALAQSTTINYPPPKSCLTAGSETTVQVGMGGYPENIDVVAIVIGLGPCFGGQCYTANSFMGEILYQGPYTRVPGTYYANYTVKIPSNFPTQEASLNVINFFMVGASYAPVVDYLSENVTIVS